MVSKYLESKTSNIADSPILLEIYIISCMHFCIILSLAFILMLFRFENKDAKNTEFDVSDLFVFSVSKNCRFVPQLINGRLTALAPLIAHMQVFHLTLRS